LTTFYPTTHKSDLKGRVVVAAAASGTPTATNAEPPTMKNASIGRPSLATITKMGHGPQIFNCTATRILLTVIVALGSVLAAPVGLFGDSERRMIGVLSMLLAVVSLYLTLAQCCSACTVNKGQLKGNVAHWISSLFRTFVSIDTMMATVELILRTVAFDACIALCLFVCQDLAKAVVGVVFVDESEHSARKEKVGGYCSAVRRRRCCPGPSALVFLALALLCGIDGGWAAFTPNVREFAKAQKVSLASFENEKNGTVLCVPGPIIHPSWDEIDPTCIFGQGLCPEGQNEGTV
jgi:hypothetical protein